MVINIIEKNQFYIFIIVIKSAYFFSKVMTSTQRFPRTIHEKQNRDIKNWLFFKGGLLSLFCQSPISRTSYHDKNYWIQYRINLVT